MKTSAPMIYRFLGFNTQGDIGPYTLYTGKRRQLVIYLSTRPKKPPSSRQDHQRNRLRVLARLWQTLSAAEREAWELAVRAAHLRITGFNLYTYSVLRADRAAVHTIEQQSGISLTYPGNEP